MKDYVIKFFCAMALCLSFTGCSSDEGDIINCPLEYFNGFRIYVHGAGKGDLLNPSTNNHIDYSKIKAIVHGKELSFGEEVHMPKVHHFDYKALVDVRKDRYGEYYLFLGEYSNLVAYRDEMIVVNWGDGTQDTITFSQDMETENYSVRLNGVEHASNNWTFKTTRNIVK